MCAMMPAGGDEGGRCVRSRPRGCQVGSTRGAFELSVECSQLVHGVRSLVPATGHLTTPPSSFAPAADLVPAMGAVRWRLMPVRPAMVPLARGSPSGAARDEDDAAAGGGDRLCARARDRRVCAGRHAATGTVTFADVPGRLRVAYDEERSHVRLRAHSAGWRHQRVDASRGSGQPSSPALH